MSMRTPSVLLQDSFTFYKEHFKILLGISVIPVAVFLLLVLATGAGYGLGGVYTAAPFGIVGTILFFVLSVLSTIALIKYVSSPSHETTIINAYKTAWPFFFSYLLVAILYSLAVLLGLVLLIVPGLIFALWYGFSYFTFLIEGKTGMAALSRSKELVKGHFGEVLWRAFVFVVLYMALAIIITIIIPGEGSKNITDLIGIFVTPYALVYFYNMYVDLKVMKDTSITQVVSEPTDASQIA